MTDADALRKIIDQERPHVIVPEIEAIATSLLVELEAAGAVRVTPTARAAQLTMNREGIRRLAAETLACRPRRTGSSTPNRNCARPSTAASAIPA